MLKAIFYSRFHPERGPSVIHQYPNGTVVPGSLSELNNTPLLVSFGDISSYIIPPYELCDQSLSVCTNGHRVLGFPISLEDAKYARNRFTFSICFVVDEEQDAEPWQQVVKKTARFFTAVEREDGVLQAEERLPGLKWAGDEGYPAQDVGVVHTLLQAIMESINTYGETCVRLNDVHVLNLRLSKPRPVPPKVRAWDVPLLVRSPPSREQWTWDLTLRRMYGHIDGVKHVQRIAELADVELTLVKRAITELLYHERAMLLDIFHFQAIYAPTPDLAWFLGDEQMLEECCRYVTVDPGKNLIQGNAIQSEKSGALASQAIVIELYTSLTPGLSLYNFVLTHEVQLANIDIRRFITFGVIKGFLRRIHKYGLAIDTPAAQALGTTDSSPTKSKPKSNEDVVKELDRAWKKAALSSGWATPPTEPPAIASLSKSGRSAEEVRSEEDEKLRGYLDAKHCLDEVWVAIRMSEKKVAERLKNGRFGEVVLFNK